MRKSTSEPKSPVKVVAALIAATMVVGDRASVFADFNEQLPTIPPRRSLSTSSPVVIIKDEPQSEVRVSAMITHILHTGETADFHKWQTFTEEDKMKLLGSGRLFS